MTDQTLVALAQAGDVDAIAQLMNTTLQSIGVQARVTLNNGILYILLESERILAQNPCQEFIQRGLARLGIGKFSSAVVYSRMPGQPTPIWVQQLELTPEADIPNPFVLAPNARLKAAQTIRQPLVRRKVHLLDLLLLSFPLLVVFNSGLIWNRYLSNREISQKGIASFFDQTDTSSEDQHEPYQQARQAALRAVQLGKMAASKIEWRQAVAEWQQAITHLQQVTESDPNYAIAQQKQQEYQSNLDSLIRDKLSLVGMDLVKTITGAISPKSIVYSGKDLFFAQNMMYRHSITVYDREYNLVKTISDAVNLGNLGYPQYPGEQQGAPVEAAFSQDGQVAWVSNYQMYGAGFKGNADDTCSPSENLDPSFLYRIDTKSLTIERAVQVGATPKFLATVPNLPYVLVSNWCSWDVSVVDTQTNQEIRRLQVGPYPRGIAVDANAAKAYVAVMGSYDVAVINLKTFEISWLKDIGNSPRHLNLDPHNGQYLYVSLNGEGKIAKLDVITGQVVSKVETGEAPRSMAISADGAFLYVVNYDSNTVSKIRTRDMQVTQTVTVDPGPIGVTYDQKTHQVWVACYSGSILVFQD
jgi:YVTN family beta-propeller protein